MSDWLTETLQTVGSAGAGSFVGWFFTRKKQAQDVKGSELENVAAAIAIWEETAKKLNERVNTLEAKVGELEKENRELRIEVETVHAENIKLKRQVG